MMSGKDIEDCLEQVEAPEPFAQITKPFDLEILLQLTINGIKKNEDSFKRN